jgi:hypothetical protein
LSSGSSEISNGAKAGIGVGVGVGAIAIIATLGFYFVRRKRKLPAPGPWTAEVASAKVQGPQELEQDSRVFELSANAENTRNELHGLSTAGN